MNYFREGRPEEEKTASEKGKMFPSATPELLPQLSCSVVVLRPISISLRPPPVLHFSLMLPLSLIAVFSFLLYSSNAEVTIYTTLATAGGPAPTPCIGAVACDGGVLNLPPNPAPGNGFSQSIPVQLTPGGANFMSVPVSPSFLGLSLELSVADKLSECSSSVHFSVHR